jgi:DNA adenine methylase
MTLNMTLSTKPQPFLKWAGGKGQLLDQYEPYFPQTPLRGYYEPFVGSGAVFFRLCERGLFESCYLSDLNSELLTCYRVVRDHVEDLITRLHEHKAHHNLDYYYATRSRDRDPSWANASPIERAARLIYLNKTCYNGLWRVNQQGFFNVPMGRYVNPDIANVDRLRAASHALQDVELAVADFEAVTEQARSGDFVYFDPPYHPLSKTASFTSYAREDFGEDDQRTLARVFAELDRRGCRVMLSNSDTPFVRELYGDYRIETVTARRAINSAKGKRGAITEVVVVNY